MSTPAPNFRALCAELVNAFDIPSSLQYKALALARARAALATPPGHPKNCWLDDEPDLYPSRCVFEDPSEVISNCTFAYKIKCKTDCQYYRVVTPPTEPPPLKLKRSGGYQHFRPKSLSPEALELWDAAEANIEASMQRVKKLTEDLSPEPPYL